LKYYLKTMQENVKYFVIFCNLVTVLDVGADTVNHAVKVKIEICVPVCACICAVCFVGYSMYVSVCVCMCALCVVL
jgi:hypothetical protein